MWWGERTGRRKGAPAVPLSTFAPFHICSSRSEQPISRVAQSRHDVALLVERPVERRAIHHDVRMSVGEPSHSFRRGDEAEKANTRRAGALQGGHGGNSAAARREHWIEKKKVSLGGVTGDLEVIIHRLERVVISVQSD